MDLFVGLSALLTGIDKTKLSPPLDPNNIKQVFYDYANAQDSAALAQLLGIYASCLAQPGITDAMVAKAVFEDSGDTMCYLARAIMLAWYLGSWYAPGDLQAYHANYAAQPPLQALPPLSGPVIAAAAYTQGWAWNIAQAHPMGYSTFTFGYWGKQPPALSAFTGARQ